MTTTTLQNHTYNYSFSNGTITLEKRHRTKTQYEWFVSVQLTTDEQGNKRFIGLDRRIFLTKDFALETTQNLLRKYSLL